MSGRLSPETLEHQTVLITGGTGSFGRTMARHLLSRGCPEIRVFSRDEAKQEAMRRDFGTSALKFYLGDVRDADSVTHAMSGVTHVFHAAALKQVPSCEFFPMQAVQTNITGSANVIEQAIRSSVQSVVCLSTDKAVYPINAMGMTKALMEKVAQAAVRHYGQSHTVISCVRYGNVMYSRGSVIPLFVEQIVRGCPLTVTDLTMTRFMMPLRDAVELVEFAFSRAEPGDIFIRKAPACTLKVLTEALKQVLNASNDVQVIGIRHGEKVYETLATKEELRRAQDFGDYYRVRMDDRDLNYDSYFVDGDPGEVFVDDFTSHNTERLEVEEMSELLLNVPEIRALSSRRDSPSVSTASVIG